MLQFGKMDKDKFILDFEVGPRRMSHDLLRCSFARTDPPTTHPAVCADPSVREQYPLSAVQAFAVALSSMDLKVSGRLHHALGPMHRVVVSDAYWVHLCAAGRPQELRPGPADGGTAGLGHSQGLAA
jgi:hypothetical protein